MKPHVILIIEDDYLDIINAERAFKKLGIEYQIHVAHNGVDALSLLNGNIPGKDKIFPDIILLDINMPKMNGIEFLRIIKNYYTFNNIKIFITTTSREEYDKIFADQLGVTGYILKPLEFNRSEAGQFTDSYKLMQELLKDPAEMN